MKNLLILMLLSMSIFSTSCSKDDYFINPPNMVESNLEFVTNLQILRVVKNNENIFPIIGEIDTFISIVDLLDRYSDVNKGKLIFNQGDTLKVYTYNKFYRPNVSIHSNYFEVISNDVTLTCCRYTDISAGFIRRSHLSIEYPSFEFVIQN